MKRYLLGAALAALTGALCPSPAHATNPSLLPFQQVPSSFSCGPAAGTQAATDVSAAGFSTCAQGSDFTASTGAGWTPNFSGSVATLSNWLDCSFGSATGSIWYWGVNSQGTQPACSGHVAQATDPLTSSPALRITLSSTDTGIGSAGMQTVNWSNNNSTPGAGSFPYGYYEWTFRNDTTDTTTLGQAFWSWETPNMITAAGLSPSNNQLLELDFVENKPTKADFGFNLWNGFNNIVQTREINLNGSLPATAYHTVGLLFTGDGASAGNFSTCSYVDGARVSCIQSTYTTAGEELEHRYMIAYLYEPPSSGTENLYIKNIKMLSCSNWQSSGSTGMCHGSTLNGTGFYVP